MIIDGLAAINYGKEDIINMFSLTGDELAAMRIFHCYAGGSVFAAQMQQQPHPVIACDPLYTKPVSEIKAKLEQTQQALLTHPEKYAITREQAEIFVRSHQAKMQLLLADLPKGIQEKRYTGDHFPTLTYEKEAFDLALIAHYLFTDDKLDTAFQITALQELMRIANEVRVFPLITRSGALAMGVGEVVAALQNLGFGVEIRSVPFMLQKQGNAMLRVWSPSCSVAAHNSLTTP